MTIKKEDLIQAFVNGASKGRGSNLVIEGSVFRNYQTIIARRQGDKIIINWRRYSQTTSRNQNLLYQFAKAAGYQDDQIILDKEGEYCDYQNNTTAE